jgi:hypothetical protein
LREPAYTASAAGAALGRGALITNMAKGDMETSGGARLLGVGSGNGSHRQDAASGRNQNQGWSALRDDQEPFQPRPTHLDVGESLLLPNLVPPWLTSIFS